MNKTTLHILKGLQQYLFVFAVLLVMLLSSCAVKASIKNLAGFPPKTEQGFPKSNKNLSIITIDNCFQVNVADTQIEHAKNTGVNDLVPILLFAAATFFFFGFRLENKENKHPLYTSSAKIRNSISIFLEYRKLLIHFCV